MFERLWGRRTRDDAEVEGRAPGAEESKATALVQRLIDTGVDGAGPFASAVSVAERARAGHPSAESAVHVVVRRHGRMAAGSGFATGVGGLVTMPVALPANIVGFYVLATRMVAAIAHLRGYDVSRPEVRSAVLLCLLGSDAGQVLRSAGLPTGGPLALLAQRRLPKDVLMIVNKGVGFRLLARLGSFGALQTSRILPVLGGVVGAGADLLLLRRIAKHAEREFTPRSNSAVPVAGEAAAGGS
ncbi:EcsC family protein [Kineococcus xinjiangensis]|uniref:EcsC family protein n=1 Tax=Kineococcus xinjiangensis TaxID=512762 RepID=A0A2S6IVQ3_9ACTN|nr:EcsC family protein [Kineococcus xinjiangensis]PPK98403.1 EcsC family protein [Kineococcus xinjiangensis]